jgi:enamine deaminase RidA (YjgF/YER057c/UK114 family)
VPANSAAATLELHGCTVTLCRTDGPQARELFFSCRPGVEFKSAAHQSDAVYRAILGVLESEGGAFDSVVTETLFLRSAREDIDAVREARTSALEMQATDLNQPATTVIQQPPLSGSHGLEVLIQAIVPKTTALNLKLVEARPVCNCAECARSHGLLVKLGDETRLYVGGLYGAGETAYEQTRDMFRVAEDLLHQAGMTFTDVARTWIYLPEMERDYPDLNRARREFFAAHKVQPSPASTGIGAGLVPPAHDICLGLYAVKSDPAPKRAVMTTPTLNEAPEYGSDFSRGMRLVEANKISLLVSGTASIDETGATVHLDDFEAQADRMLVNVAALLEGQGAGFGDVVSAITYLKHPEDATHLRQKFREAGYEGFPNVLVEAPVCRPELLCETEALAVLPRSPKTRAH